MKMKPTFLRSAICALTILLTVFVGCKKSSNDPVPDPVQFASGSMSFKLGDVKYTMPVAQGAYGSGGGFYVYVTTAATINTSQTAILSISSINTLKNGSYSFVFEGNYDPKEVMSFAVVTDVAKQTVFANYPGAKTTVTITSISKTIMKGTFTSEVAEYNEATLTWINKRNVTEGTFSVPLTKLED